jgi:23S rRNA (guanosine2251-2'-O)-methyltransferase
LFIILDGIEDPHNLGAILRTADATGAHGVIIRERRAVGLTPIVEKASAGALEYIPVARVANISQTIETLKKNNVWIVGIDQTGDINYTQVDYVPPTALVIGGEGQGLSNLVKKHCDFLAFIPMKGKISSLNASVATGVAMYEVVRQRLLKDSPNLKQP